MEIRTTKPGKGNKYYIRKASGGWSPCIKGKPTDSACDVLSNCVGYAVGRFNEISNAGKIKYFTSMNAENFYANAYKWGLKTGQEPKQGAVMVWSKGKPGVSSDGAGHVAIVEKVYSKTSVLTSESGWKSFAFKNRTRNKGSNGNWGSGRAYHFLGFIYNPDVIDTPKVPGVPKDENKDQVLVKATNLRIREGAGTGNTIVGYVIENNYYNYTEVKEEKDYNWYRIGDKQWIANTKDGKYLEVIPKVEPKPEPPKPEPQPTPTGLKVGDKVRIIGTGYSNIYGKGGHKAGGIGWVRYIKKIYDGKEFPYQVGNDKGTTGFYKAKSLRKL